MRILRWLCVVSVAALAVAWRAHRTRRDADARVWADATDRIG